MGVFSQQLVLSAVLLAASISGDSLDPEVEGGRVGVVTVIREGGWVGGGGGVASL